jgi:hypothetical protein
MACRTLASLAALRSCRDRPDFCRLFALVFRTMFSPLNLRRETYPLAMPAQCLTPGNLQNPEGDHVVDSAPPICLAACRLRRAAGANVDRHKAMVAGGEA